MALVDSYIENNYSDDYVLSSSVDQYQAIGQSFEGDGGVLATCQFYMRKHNSPYGYAYAKIYTHTGTWGSSGVPGTLLATSGAVLVSGLESTDTLTTFTFSGANKITLVDGTHYCLVLEYSDGDATNNVYTGYDSSTPAHAGNLSKYILSTWSASALKDLCFYVYSDDSVSSPSSSPSSSTSSSPSSSASTSASSSPSPSAGDLIDSYGYEEATIAITLASTTYLQFGQAFTGDGTAADTCRFYVIKVGSPTGNCRAKIYAETHETDFGTDSEGTGTALATSDDYDVSTLSDSVFTLLQFTFTGETVLAAATKYVLVLEYAGGDDDNYVAVCADIDELLHDGNTCFYSSAYGWGSFSTMDTCFYLYGKALGGSSTSSSPSASASASVSSSPSSSPSPSASLSNSPSASLSHSASASPSASVSPSPSQARGGIITVTGRGYLESASPSSSPSSSPSGSSSASPSTSVSSSPSRSASSSPSASASSSPSSSPSPSNTPSSSPSSSTSHSRSASPSSSPSASGGSGNVVVGKKSTITYFRKRKAVEKPEE
jgi:hypothetical protein